MGTTFGDRLYGILSAKYSHPSKHHLIPKAAQYISDNVGNRDLRQKLKISFTADYKVDPTYAVSSMLHGISDVVDDYLQERGDFEQTRFKNAMRKRFKF